MLLLSICKAFLWFGEQLRDLVIKFRRLVVYVGQYLLPICKAFLWFGERFRDLVIKLRRLAMYVGQHQGMLLLSICICMAFL